MNLKDIIADFIRKAGIEEEDSEGSTVYTLYEGDVKTAAEWIFEELKKWQIKTTR